MKNYARNLGFEYLCASCKEEFEHVYERFLTPNITEKPILFEVFTDSAMESKALENIMSIEVDAGAKTKQIARQILGDSGVKALKKIIGR